MSSTAKASTSTQMERSTMARFKWALWKAKASITTMATPIMRGLGILGRSMGKGCTTVKRRSMKGSGKTANAPGMAITIVNFTKRLLWVIFYADSGTAEEKLFTQTEVSIKGSLEMIYRMGKVVLSMQTKISMWVILKKGKKKAEGFTTSAREQFLKAFGEPIPNWKRVASLWKNDLKHGNGKLNLQIGEQYEGQFE